MLTEIMKALEGGQHFSLGELAKHLNTDVQFIKAQIDFLESNGYIKKVNMNVNRNCSGGCSSCGGCSPQNLTSFMWELNQS